MVVVLPGYQLPDGFEPRVIELLLMLPFGFPDTQPDMFWADPHVTLHGAAPQATEMTQPIIGRQWQRFSRHLTPGTWRSGVDDLRSWLSLIATILAREAEQGRAAA